ncbi:MAG: UDP-N-acetylmuramoyl-tripeptide--D-alanyl-D-alanine ligase [Candidatus Bipolaricaulota bacterium]|nr:UDP-N-acetylmuramoyl-tripeptide--D-alanyl-D-alanine ligase [Candidatus Bipolaricaulota bacterium]MDW8031775.1 UDP-N-acetylmuramoyl-tripeptide--D-alanyl-D-alanine ligase [Candidatus Bipolaricaulota bacterium]
MKFSAREIAHATGGTLVHGLPEALVDGVSTDSRALRPGQLFVPLVGSRCDGHDFIADALARGAAGFLFTQSHALIPRQGIAIHVQDTRRALSDLARWALAKLNAPIIAVAGSNGKTTTKELTAQVLAQRFRTHATVGNQNTEIGLPLTVLNAPDETEVLVLEMGTTAVGDVRRLCRIAPPTLGVLTSISEEHLATLGSFEQIMEAETELLEALPGEGLAIVNGDHPDLLAVAQRKARSRLVTFGFAPQNDFVAEELHISREGTRFSLRSPRGRSEVQLSLLGRPAVLAALAATAVAHHFGLTPSEIRHGLKSARGAWGRLQLLALPTAPITVLHDAYNANPASMREAILCAAQIRHPDEALIFVLGDMLELGAWSEQAHRELGRFVAHIRPDRLIVVGEHARFIGEEAARAGVPVQYHATADEVDIHLEERRCLILLKGSRGMHLERVLEALDFGCIL